MYSEVTAYWERQLLPVAEQELPAAIAGKMRSYLTEVHRLVKLLQRDLVFWYSAQQPQIREQRRLEILAKLEVTIGFAQSMMEELAMAIDL